MDMDFFNDQILTDLDQSDYVGGIDNEGIFFDDLHVTTGAAANRLDNNVNHLNDDTLFLCNGKSETPLTALTSGGRCRSNNDGGGGGGVTDTVLPSMPSITAKICLPTISQMGISVNHNHHHHHTHTHSHLPESPPDSGSEPPYSPPQDNHGLTFTSRDFFNPAQANGAATSALNELHSIPTLQQQQQQQQPQLQQQSHLSHQHIPSATQQPPQQTSHNSYAHLLQTSLIANSLTTTTNHGNDNMNSVRVKHESGLLLNPCHLPTSTNSLRSNENGLPSASTSPLLMYTSTNNHMGYDGLLNGNGSTCNTTPSTTSYHVSFGNGGGGGGSMDHSMAMAAACMLNTVSDLPHVQAIGTSHASIPSTPQLSRTPTPSTPNQSLSRKRKMIADIDDTAYVSSIKSDPSMVMSPSRNSVCSTPTQQQLNGTKLSSTSPITIQLGNSLQNATSINDFGGTMTARSTASVSPALSTSNTNTDNGLDSLASNCPTNRSSENVSDSLSPCIRFSPFQPQNWHKLCDQNLQELSVVYYRVDADKGFNFSLSDDAFVCQKKNHFQITCHARLQGEAKFVKTPAGLEKIKSFHLHFFGVKMEAPNQTIRVEQSQSDRSKKPFYPVPIDLQSHIVSKVTVGRLHFSETTNNNMRKKGRPNPEQRYFQLVVALHVHTASGDFPIISQGSDKIIVRASNPGQFESDVDLCWQRGLTQDSIYHVGRVGINTDRPDESLVVHGNLKISGHIVQPSDSRAKQEIAELDTSVQLRNLQKIRIVKYRLEPEFAAHSGLKRNTDADTDDIVDTGVIAQEVREVIPDAVQEGGSVVLPNGDVIENFLLVNKDRILMENIGAVKELCKVTGTLETRIENLERINQRLQRAKETEKLYKSISHKNENEMCSNRTLQIIIFLLVIVMAICLAAVSALYFVEHNRKQHIFKHLESIQVLSNSHFLYRPDAISLADQERMFLQNRLNKTVNFHYQTTNGSASIAGKNFTLHRGQHSYVEPLNEAAARNDELTAIMEKPLIEQELKQSISRTTLRTTTLPLLRLNKTINSKGKIKPQMGRNTVYRTIYNRPSESTNAPPQLINAADTASEKINSNSRLTAQQDWDSNSIDADVQHAAGVRPKGTPVIKARLPQSKDTLRHGHGGTDGQKLSSEAAMLSTLNSNIYKMPDENAAVQTNSLPRANAVAAPPVPHKTNSPLIQAAVSSTTAATSSTSITTTSPSITATTKIVQKIHTEAPPPPHNSNYSLEIQPITNKSRTVLERPTDNSEDLQSLSNNNESAYNIIRDPLDLIFYNNVRSSASITDVQRLKPQQHQHRQPELTKDVNDWVIEEHLYVETFGEPEQCANKIHPADVSSCQSMCFGENNQLLTPNQLGLGLKQTEKKKSDNSAAVVEIVQKENHNRNDDNERGTILSEDEDELQATYDGTPTSVKNTANTTSLLLVGSKVSHNGQALNKDEAESAVADIMDSLLARTFPDDNADILESKVVKKTKTEFSKQQPIPTHSLLRELNQPSTDETDCWKVQGFLVTENFNETFSMNEYCPKSAKSVNATIVIPLSRYFNRPNIELHLISTVAAVQWTICDNYELAKSNGKQLQQQQQQQIQIQIFQHLHNTSVLRINLPSRGDFVKYLTLRATITSEKKKESLCQENAYETNPIIQYNFRILRNCD